MSAGFKYNLTPEPSIEERYDVSTGIRRRGAYQLITTDLSIGESLPSFLPINADLKSKKCYVVRNVLAVEAYKTGDLVLKIKKGSFAYRGMLLTEGKNVTTIDSIDKSNTRYDILTVSDLGVELSVGTVLFEAKAEDDPTPKNTANSALYESRRVEEGHNLVALLAAAREIEPDKLIVPFSTVDKERLGSDFQFNE